MASEPEELDIDALPPVQVSERVPIGEPRVRLAVQEGAREFVRLLIAGALVAILIAIVILSLQKVNNWSETKDLLQILLPAVTALLGSTIGFYFGSRRE